MSITRHSQVAKRYAEALFATLVQSEQTTSSINEELKNVLTVLQDPKVQSAFLHPKTSRERKGQLIRLMKLSPIAENFLLLLVEKSRETLLPSIVYHFEQLVLNADRTAIADVVAAVPLTSETLEGLKQRLSILTGKSIRLQTKVDPSIGGGMIIKVDGKVIDGSVNNTLKQFQRSLRN
ncbi:MAG: ATP synthase F1 subunit delta [Limnochordia bacterium]|jgi:F-type H+-transporting ATPase subunit delta|nr:ATP synthase F1 subunit delta [Limnochordia bacterium]